VESLKLLTQDLLDAIAIQSRSSPRLRQNYNFHDLSERVQRFINMLQPDTYVRPHRHRRASEVNGFEFFLVLQGELGIMVMDEQGQILHREQVSAQGKTRGIELAEGTYHSLIALAPDTAILELKEGPYDLRTDKEFLTIFPEEGTLAAQEQVKRWQQDFSDLSQYKSL
jgi:cupin fold WbuC family metalloprotein